MELETEVAALKELNEELQKEQVMPPCDYRFD